MKLQASSLLEIARTLQLTETDFVELEKRYCPVPIRSEEDFFQLILTIGNTEGEPGRAQEVVLDLEERIAIVKHKLKFIDEHAKPGVVCLTGIHSLELTDNPYWKTIIKVAGGKTYDIKQIDEAGFNPDILLIFGNPMEQLFEYLPRLLSLNEWRNTTAVKNNAVFLLNGKNHFQGLGLKLADDIESLAEIFYPQQLTYGRNGDTWIHFELN